MIQKDHSAQPISNQSTWIANLVSLLPIIVVGPMRIFVSFQPGWDPREGSVRYLIYLIFGTLILVGGLLVGTLKKSPRWVYPYVLLLAFSLYILTLYLGTFLPVEFNLQSSFFFYLAIILAFLWLPPFRVFYHQIAQDWTLLSYGLYGLVFYLFSSIDFDQTPNLEVLVLAPALVALVTALAHLRVQSTFLRIAVLIGGTVVGLIFWLIPAYVNMDSVWISIIMGVLLLLTYGITLSMILLSPWLATLAIQFFKRSFNSVV